MSDVAGAFDRAESREQFEEAGRRFGAAFERLQKYVEQIDSLGVSTSSSLSADDRATARDPISHQVQGALVVATDHMGALQGLIAHGKTLPTFGAYSITRPALEAVGSALWQLLPPSRDLRVMQSLQVMYESERDLRVAAAEMTGSRPKANDTIPTDDPLRGRIEELRDARPALVGRRYESVASITQRLQYVDDHYGSHGMDRITGMWRVASGLAHGRRSMSTNALDRRISGASEGRVNVVLSASLSSVWNIYDCAEKHLVRLMNLFEQRGQPRVSSEEKMELPLWLSAPVCSPSRHQ
ncbi:hypothetical protein [Pseudoclavibacter sp. RFBA6]|uniref:hypothetical protein n=1 Tax=Pseudoclavibacter sp. RFBA6 TaxID=2080573 RepID=UPI000CE8A6DE|nr:hypothetical protein [Pseudoclavibacter sp. RFBA6]PPG38024.1 hypothetical protein C5C17_15325 [Pseudoclavibacter sp. RFBA6]